VYRLPFAYKETVSSSVIKKSDEIAYSEILHKVCFSTVFVSIQKLDSIHIL